MKKLVVLFCLLFSCVVHAQQPIVQSGFATPGHALYFLTNGVAADAGTAAQGFLTSIGVTAQGPGICQNSAPITQSYNQICLVANSTGNAGISFFNHGTTAAFTISVNGVVYQFPFTGSGAIGPPSTVVGDFSCWNNTVGTLLSDCRIGPPSTVVGDVACWDNTVGTLLSDCGGKPGGTSGEVQINDGSGGFAGITNTQLTALINPATASLSGALPAWPNNTTTFFRGDGTYVALPIGSNSQKGVLQCDGTSALCPSGIVSVNSINPQTASYAIATTDCGKRISISGGMFTVTLPAASGFSNNCIVGVINSDTSDGMILSGFPSRHSGYLYPTQFLEVENKSGTWVITYEPGKWQPTSSTSLYVDQSGSDNNDCLATGPTRACASINTAITRWSTDLQCSSATNPIITLGAGNFFASLDINGIHFYYAMNCGSPGGEMQIVGAGHASTTITCNAAINCLDIQEPATVSITGVTVSTNGNGSTAINIRQGATGDLSDVAFTAFPSGQDIIVTTGSHFNQTGELYVTGNSTTFLTCEYLSFCNLVLTVNVSGGLTYSVFLEATFGGILETGGTLNFTGSGAGTGTTATQCAAGGNGIIHLNGGSISTFPGTATTCGSGQTATQGQIY